MRSTLPDSALCLIEMNIEKKTPFAPLSNELNSNLFSHINKMFLLCLRFKYVLFSLKATAS